MLTHWLDLLPCFRKHFPNLWASCTLLNGSELTGGENNSSTFLQLLAIHVTPLSLITSANFTPVKDLIKSSVGSLVPSGVDNEPFCASEFDFSLACAGWSIRRVRCEFYFFPCLLCCFASPSSHMGGYLGNAQVLYFDSHLV